MTNRLYRLTRPYDGVMGHVGAAARIVGVSEAGIADTLRITVYKSNDPIGSEPHIRKEFADCAISVISLGAAFDIDFPTTGRETCGQITAWCRLHYPETVTQMAIALVEEAVELGCVLGVGHRWMHEGLKRTGTGTLEYELRNCWFALNIMAKLTGARDMSEILDEVMEANRHRDPAESARRAAAKRELGIDL